MLQRAASNAYSWWWASHVRTKQSKWLEQNLEDMEEKVKCMLKIIEDDGDSFAKRAEMYYRRRPELICFVEESFRAYRALAERYEHLAGELQSANQTIASVFPEHAQLAMDEEDECAAGTPRSSRGPSPSNPGKTAKPLPAAPAAPPKFTMVSDPQRRSPSPKPQLKKSATKKVTNSHLSKSEALEEIDKLQKGILALQTEKEFMKGLYENGLAKYWDIENQISDMQKHVCTLQEEFGVSKAIEDDEARTLMATTALKACQETLIHLQAKQERTNEEAKVEDRRIKAVCEKLEILKDEYLHNRMDEQKSEHETPKVKVPRLTKAEEEQQVGDSKLEKRDLGSICEKMYEHLETHCNASLDVAALAEKIDELVTKVINLETSVSSQAALIERLRSETSELHTKVQRLEEDKATLIKGSNNMNNKLQELDSELRGIQELNQNVTIQNNTLQLHFTEAHSDFEHISDELQSGKQLDEVEGTSTNPFEEEMETPLNDEMQKESKERDVPTPVVDAVNKMDSLTDLEEVLDDNAKPKENGVHDDHLEEVLDNNAKPKENGFLDILDDHAKPKDNGVLDDHLEESPEPKLGLADKKQVSFQMEDKAVVEPQDPATDQEDQPNWHKLFIDGLQDREKILLVEYTTTLRNYKDMKKKLTEVEKKSHDALHETTHQLRKLVSVNVRKDDEIRSLRQKLNLLQKNSDTSSPNTPTSNTDKGFENQNVPQAETPPPEENEEVKVILADESPNISPVEEKFRRDIDGLLEENLKFWLKFSTSFHQIQKFQTAFQDLEAEYMKLRENKKQDEGTTTTTTRDIKSEARPIYKHLREIQNEMKVWLEQSAVLKDELQCRRASLGKIQEEISKVSEESSENEKAEFTSYQAGKFQGEVLNMQQENNKVADELQAGLDHVKIIQDDIEKTLTKINEDHKLPETKKGEMRPSLSKSQIPLRSFLFGSKPKKQRHNFFTRIQPVLHKHNQKS